MKLSEYIDVDLLISDIDQGYVETSHHSSLPLTLYCYTRQATDENHWDDATTKCRGLIVEDGSGEIIARPFEKFFGLGEQYTPEQLLAMEQRPAVADKLNGSLGIYWSYQGEFGVTTKGSFHSPHGAFATTWLKEHVELYGPLSFPDGYTPVFEIICQEIQRHVVSYPADGLVLIALVRNQTGEELPPFALQQYGKMNYLNVSQFYTFIGTQQLSQFDRPNKEGFVLSYPRIGTNPVKVKIKHKTFLELRMIMRSATTDTILNLLAEGKEDTLTNWADSLPEELGVGIRYKVEIFKMAYTLRFEEASRIVKEALRVCTTRREVSQFLHQPENKKYSAICFAMIDNTTNKKELYRKLIYKLVGKEVKLDTNKSLPSS